MKKTVCIFLAFVFGISGVFACRFGKITHKLSECEEYKTVPMPKKCREAHEEYNKWVLEQTKAKFKKTIDSVKKGYKDTSDQVKEDTKKITEQAESAGHKVKDSFFKLLEKNFSDKAEADDSEDIEDNIL